MTKNMTNLPRLELTENPNKKSDFIIFRKSTKHVSKKTRRKRKRNRTRKTGVFKLFL